MLGALTATYIMRYAALTNVYKACQDINSVKVLAKWQV